MNDIKISNTYYDVQSFSNDEISSRDKDVLALATCYDADDSDSNNGDSDDEKNNNEDNTK